MQQLPFRRKHKDCIIIHFEANVVLGFVVKVLVVGNNLPIPHEIISGKPTSKSNNHSRYSRRPIVSISHIFQRNTLHVFRHIATFYDNSLTLKCEEVLIFSVEKKEHWTLVCVNYYILLTDLSETFLFLSTVDPAKNFIFCFLDNQTNYFTYRCWSHR